MARTAQPATSPVATVKFLALGRTPEDIVLNEVNELLENFLVEQDIDASGSVRVKVSGVEINPSEFVNVTLEDQDTVLIVGKSSGAKN